ncbi:MAG: efflux RND transporter permease subunit [Gammaproteobacteria bacterium]|nr:MAG: efflux RND transporter permease subunit [Gammaproteobacteria bacterium]
MKIVQVALQRPHTFIVLALLILLLGVFTILRIPIDIFPNINIPVIAAIWSYTGLSPDDMAKRIILLTEKSAQTDISNVEHTESQSLNGIGVAKYFFQPNVNEDLSYAQITGMSQTLLKSVPPGTTPPSILAYNASTVPVIQLALSSSTLSESQIFDLGANVVRTTLATVPGAAIPFPYGGKLRQIQVDLDPKALRADGLSGTDVTSAIAAQNLILPAGTQKIGSLEYYVRLNASPTQVAQLNDLPVATHNGSVIYVRDVAHVRDGSPPQTNIVRQEGQRAALMSILKTGTSSTLDVINGIKQKLPQMQALLPPGLKIQVLGDQSIFVRSALSGVVREGAMAAVLTGLMVLLFLGSWRSTAIIFISIPLSILASVVCLSGLGQTINIMTLGGLALAVGILVDNATVTIENINSHLEQGKAVEPAILDGAQQIALPMLVSTLAICIVFVPMFMLTGIAGYLFVPFAEAVVFAMLASYLLSLTLVPTLAKYWLRPHEAQAAGHGVLARFQAGFDRLRKRYHTLLEAALRSGARFAGVFLLAMASSAILAFPFGRFLPGLGQDFFPSVDSGQILLHVRARTGLRIEQTAALCDAIEATIRQSIPASELSSVVDNIGVPYSGINLAYSTSGPIGPSDADIYLTLGQNHHPTATYVSLLRHKLSALYPSTSFAFLPADITSQILNFGLPSPLDIQISGPNVDADRQYADLLLQKVRAIPGAVDVRIQQAFDYPQLNVNVDRSKARLVGLTQSDVASKLNDLAATPLRPSSGAPAQMLSNVAVFHRSAAPGVVSHYNAMPVIDIYGSVQGTDLGFMSAQVNKIIASQHDLPRGAQVFVRGQVQTMNASFNGLLAGLVGAIVLIYLLMVVNFRSWLDPFIIITALPAALAGIVWMLFLTHTTVSVPALTGAIMCMGVATANSVLIVSFARERMAAGDDAFSAASQAGFARFRPVLMTALAMIIGMVPMALGLGEGGEQNAPLGRAVIGGLVLATVATLLFVPTVFRLIHGRRHAAQAT